MSKEYRHLHLVGATGSVLRTAVFNDTEHIVVPVTMMVEGVVWAVNSQYPELVLAEELAVSPQQWNGRACFAGHPEDEGTQVTANTPAVLQTSFGYIFQASDPRVILATKRLDVEAWLDPKKAEKVGPDAVDVIRRLKAGETVEVSMGCFVVAEQGEGEWHGKPYVGIWREIVSDHLAFLRANEEGACSVQAGCGAARHAVRHLITSKGIEMASPAPSPKPAPTPTPPKTTPHTGGTPSKTPTRSLYERFKSLIMNDESRWNTSDVELRSKLYNSLNTDVPAFMGIMEVDPDEGYVIYEANPDNEWKTYRRGFTELASGDIKLKATIEQVEMTTEYKVVGRASEAKPPCGCGGSQPTPAGEEYTMRDSTKQLIANSNGRFTDADAKWLDAIPEDKVALFTPVTPAAPAAPVAEPEVKVAAAKELTEEEWLKTAPKAVRERFAAMKAADEKDKTDLVAKLKDAQDAFDEVELGAMELPFLRKLAKSLRAEEDFADYSGRVTPRALADKEDVRLNPPDPYTVALRKLRGETV